MATQTTTFKVALIIGGIVEIVPITVTTNQGEDVPENLSNPKTDETRAAWQTRHFDTVKESRATAVVYE